MRLIDGDALMEQMKCRKYVGRPSDPVCLVEDAPTIDAVPAVHGNWKIVYGNERERLHVFECTVCKMHTGNGEGFNYCPFCGAKMDAKWWEKNGEVKP